MDEAKGLGVKKIKLNILIILGMLFLLYAFLGNYLALPGYLRFLARGRTSASGAAFDLSVLVGAFKTILWMFSFQLGVYFSLLGILVKVAPKKIIVALVAAGGACWLGFSGIPKISSPYVAFFAVSGFITLALIGAVLWFWYLRERESGFSVPSLYRLVGYVFFALVSWDLCGLGTTGRILHLDMAVQAGTQGLLVTQTSKIMVESLLAWGFTAIGLLKYDHGRISARRK
jgi:hypothetical protein